MEETDQSDGVIEHLVRDQYAQLVRAIALVSGMPSAAEDAAQEALARCWDRLRAGEQLANPAGWVVVTGANLARDRRRRDGAEQRAVERIAASAVDPAVDPAVEAELDELRTAVGSLPQRQRQVAVLHYFLGFKVAEIAGALDVSEGNVKNALFRARVTLARALTIDEGVGP